jgi:hypothetical protein
MQAVLEARKQEDDILMKTLKPIKEKVLKKKKEKGYRTVTCIKLLPGDTFIREMNLVPVQIKNE